MYQTTRSKISDVGSLYGVILIWGGGVVVVLSGTTGDSTFSYAALCRLSWYSRRYVTSVGDTQGVELKLFIDMTK